ncbi:MAG: hypothetical protein ABI577_10910 [bacterium]
MNRSLVRAALLAGAVVASSIGFVACGDDSSQLKTDNSDLRTQLAVRTETPASIPTPDTSSFCQAVTDFRAARGALIERFNQINATDQYFGSITPSEERDIQDLEIAALNIPIALPQAGSSGILRMNTLVLTLKATDQKFVAAIHTKDYAAHQAARDEANAAAEELQQLQESLCP